MTDWFPLYIIAFGIYSIIYGAFCYTMSGFFGLLFAINLYLLAGILGIILKWKK